MSRRVVCIVEGHGEVESIPLLLRRLHGESSTLVFPEIRQNDVIRIPRSRLLRDGELERTVELAARRAGPQGCVLIVLDADDDLPCELVPRLLVRARTGRPELALGLVLARREYEAWFLAAARSLRGHVGLPAELEPPPEPEAIRDAKGWPRTRMSGARYRPLVHQSKLTAAMDLSEARTAPSFDKLVREVSRLLAR